MSKPAAQDPVLRAGMKVHFIGIGGAGMSAIARVMAGHPLGVKVSGSDLKSSANTDNLISEGVKVTTGHKAENVEGKDLVVRSSAISERNPELKAARSKGVPVIERAQALQLIAQEYGTKIFVAGTHGKTTTTSMTAMVMKAAGLDPTFVIGGELNDIGSNAGLGASQYFVAEADESDRSFLYYTPDISIVTNIEGDHFDQYGSEADIDQTFEQYLKRTGPSGTLIICGDNDRLKRIAERAVRSTSIDLITYGLGPDNEFTVENVELGVQGSNFDVVHGGVSLATAHLKVPGVHNIQNSLATFALSRKLGAPLSATVEGLAGFGGVKRRFERVAEEKGILVVDDYAHHPTEIVATIKAARTVTSGRIIAVFQPHRFSRTINLADELGSAFDEADEIVLTDIYGAGEEPVPGITGKTVLDRMLERTPGRPVAYLPDIRSIHRYLSGRLRTGDTVLIMGAGDIYSIAPEIAQTIQNN